MRITNVSPVPYVFSYASPGTGGRRLAPGETSPVLPFERLVLDAVWRDVRSGKIQFKLDKGDKDFINDILEQDKREVVVQKPKVVAPPPKPVAKTPATLVKPKDVKPGKSKATNLPLNFQAHDVISGKVSIKQLLAQNEAEKNKPVATAPLSPKPGVPNIEQVGTAAADPEKRMADIQSFMGGPLGSKLHGGSK